jgi:hypothetical protein
MQQPYPTRKAFKAGIKQGKTQSFGLFINSSSPQIAEQLAAAGDYDWLLVDSQHSPVGTSLMQYMLSSLAVHNCPSLVRVGGPDDRIGTKKMFSFFPLHFFFPAPQSYHLYRQLFIFNHIPNQIAAGTDVGLLGSAAKIEGERLKGLKNSG